MRREARDIETHSHGGPLPQPVNRRRPERRARAARLARPILATSAAGAAGEINIRKIALALALTVATASPAAAAVTFTLNNVTFQGGGGANGSFTIDDAITAIQDFRVTTTAGTFTSPFGTSNALDTTYAPTNFLPAVAVLSASRTSITFSQTFNGIGQYNFVLDLARALGTGTNGVGVGREEFLFYTRAVTGGQVVGVAAAVPEPATWGLMLAGFAAVGVGSRLHRRARRAGHVARA
jgi:hypothetical protein